MPWLAAGVADGLFPHVGACWADSGSNSVTDCMKHHHNLSGGSGDEPEHGGASHDAHAHHGDHGHHHDRSLKPSAGAKYFCPMYAGVESDEPGDCPKCGMPLERNPAWVGSGKTIYTCPMHPEVRQDHPGDCPKCGMPLEPIAAATDVADDEEDLKRLARKLWVGAILALPVFLSAMAGMIPGLPLSNEPAGWRRWMEFVLATPVVVWSGDFIWRRAWNSIRHRSANMYTLLALGIGAAYAFSVVALLAPGLFPHEMQHGGATGLYFEAAAVITVLAVFGEYLQERARKRTGQAVKALLGLAPKTARRVRAGQKMCRSTRFRSAICCAFAPARKSLSTASLPKAPAMSTSRCSRVNRFR